MGAVEIPAAATQKLFAGSSLFEDYAINIRATSSPTMSAEAEQQSYLDLPPSACNPLNFGTITGNNLSCSTKCLGRFCAHEQVKRFFSISGHILSHRRLMTTDKNLENILFANVSYEVFAVELRKRKQPYSDDNNQ